MNIHNVNGGGAWRDFVRTFDICSCLLNNSGKFYGKLIVGATGKIHNILAKGIPA
jgi:hypothetical protein